MNPTRFEMRLQDLDDANHNFRQVCAQLKRIELVMRSEDNYPVATAATHEIATNLEKIITDLESAPPGLDRWPALALARELLAQCHTFGISGSHNKTTKPRVNKKLADAVKTLKLRQESEQRLIHAWRYGTLSDLRDAIGNASENSVCQPMVRFVSEKLKEMEQKETAAKSDEHIKKIHKAPRFRDLPEDNRHYNLQRPRPKPSPYPSSSFAQNAARKVAPPSQIHPSQEPEHAVADAARRLDRALRIKDSKILDTAIKEAKQLLLRLP